MTSCMYVYVYACEKNNKYRRTSKTSAYAHPTDVAAATLVARP